MAETTAGSRDVGVLLVGQGSTRCSRPDDLVARHAAALNRRGRFAEVGAATIAGRPNPREALARMRSREIVVVPFLMCDGTLYHEALPPALAGAGEPDGRRINLCRPLGLHPLVADLVLQRAVQGLRDHELAAAATALVLIGHGSSRDPASAAALALQAERLRTASTFHSVEMAFIGQPPFLQDVLASAHHPLMAIALFAARGNHVVEDIEKLFVRSARRDRIASFLGTLGEDDQIVAIIEQMATEKLRSEEAPSLV